MNYSRLLFLISFLAITTLFANGFEDIKIISKSIDEVIVQVDFQEIKINARVSENSELNHSISFKNARFPESDNIYELPSRIFNIALPEQGDLSFQVISKTQKTFSDINIKESESYGEIQEDRSLVEIGPVSRFRDFNYRSIQVNNVSYNNGLKTVTIVDNITIKISFSGKTNQTGLFKTNGKLDKIYKQMFVNFDQAKSWQIKKKFSFSKSASLDNSLYYGIKVTEDGIYKVTSTILKNNGIDTDVLSINALQLYNNGGHHLNLATTADQYNPSYTEETGIKVFDLNQNNLFDGNDYFLFYGKSLIGWFYNSASGIFEHQMHNFDTENWYYLAINGNSGKRIEAVPFQNQNGLPVQEYFIERFHYENDIYNPLHSGPDWYGHRFFGKSGSHSVSFNTNNVFSTGPSAEIQVKMKGGTRIHYGDNGNYYYNFSISLNSTPLDLGFHNSGTSFRNYFSKVDNEFFDSSVLGNGNSLNFSYSSTDEKSTVYLDWFSVYYPKRAITSANFISFFADAGITPKNIRLSGFSAVNDLYLLDVTDPVNPELLLTNYEPISGNMDATIPETWTSKKLVAFSLSSSNIKSVSQFKTYRPRNNLLDITKSADFIVITSNSLLEYAHEIADLRDHLRTEVASVEDINFFFNNGVNDPTAIRNFIKYAYNNWQLPAVSYVLLFGDGHYDYKNIIHSDSIIVPTFQIESEAELQPGTNDFTRESDLFFGQIYNNNPSRRQQKIIPSVAIGRLPVENSIDAERVVEKLMLYDQNVFKDGWQTNITFVSDDSVGNSAREYLHQNVSDSYTKKLNQFLQNKIYSASYESVPGGLGILKPDATRQLIDQINRGTLLINFTGHGSPVQWAGESILNFDRDYSRLNNEAKFPFIVAATCDFGIFDNPDNRSFCEALIWKENSGAIGVLAATRLVYASQNNRFAGDFYDFLFPANSTSSTLGDAFVLALSNINNVSTNFNDQKFHLLADPSMNLADSKNKLEILPFTQDTLRALNEVQISGRVMINGEHATSFNGGAVLIVNDATFQDIKIGSFNAYDKNGPLIFKGEVSVENGLVTGSFIVPKSIRYQPKKTGRITFYAWDDETNQTAGGYIDTLLFYGSSILPPEPDGPEIDIYFEDYENFETGDMLPLNPVLIADLSDESGINMTGQLGHKIELQIDGGKRIDISESFVYNRDSHKNGIIRYPVTGLNPGLHNLTLQAFDNLNNRTEQQVTFTIIANEDVVLNDVVNYPNPFRQKTEFTFRTNIPGAEYTLKIYTIAGRLIEKLEGITDDNYNSIPWNGLDRDGNELANGVYLYKITLKHDGKVKEKIEKMVVLR